MQSQNFKKKKKEQIVLEANPYPYALSWYQDIICHLPEWGVFFEPYAII